MIGVPVRRNMSWREARKEKDVVVSTALDAYRRLYLQLGGKLRFEESRGPVVGQCQLPDCVGVGAHGRQFLHTVADAIW